jgi:uncharacterized protein (TIGR02246 family)
VPIVLFCSNEENCRSRQCDAPAIANVRAPIAQRKKKLGEFENAMEESGSGRIFSHWIQFPKIWKERNVKHFVSGVLLLLLAATSNAQSKKDEETVRNLPQAFCDAWAKHDGHQLAKIMAEDVDFVTVATTYLHGRADFEKFHVRLLSGRFKESTVIALQTTVRFLRPDMAVVHWSWKIEGDKNFDGVQRQEPRYGMMTMVGEKRAGTWLVVVAQNTNAMPGIPPELQDIKTPIPIPGTDKKPQ